MAGRISDYPLHFSPQSFSKLLALGLALCLSACSSNSSFSTVGSSDESSNVGESTPDLGPADPPEPPNQSEPETPTPEPETPYSPLSWEVTNNAEKSQWSKYVFSVIENETFSLLDGADDIGTFCPKYSSLEKYQKINFWGMLVSAMSKFESNYDPLMRYKETTMGRDAITGQAVYSEGLLQLSYQDIQWMPRCEFNWNLDRSLAVTDARKTILNPQKNLRCGLLILERQLQKYHRITIDSGAYWAVIKSGGKYQKITQIAAMTKSLPFCQ